MDPADTPCTKYLAINEEGELVHGDLEYWSIVKQLNYLQGHSWPDITMTISQCACSHELTLLQIRQYLKGIPDQGLVLWPKDTHLLKTDAYVDATFACHWVVSMAQILIVSNLVLGISLRSHVVQYCGYRSCKQQL